MSKQEQKKKPGKQNHKYLSISNRTTEWSWERSLDITLSKPTAQAGMRKVAIKYIIVSSCKKECILTSLLFNLAFQNLMRSCKAELYLFGGGVELNVKVWLSSTTGFFLLIKCNYHQHVQLQLRKNSWCLSSLSIYNLKKELETGLSTLTVGLEIKPREPMTWGSIFTSLYTPWWTVICADKYLVSCPMLPVNIRAHLLIHQKLQLLSEQFFCEIKMMAFPVFERDIGHCWGSW